VKALFLQTSPPVGATFGSESAWSSRIVLSDVGAYTWLGRGAASWRCSAVRETGSHTRAGVHAPWPCPLSFPARRRFVRRPRHECYRPDDQRTRLPWAACPEYPATEVAGEQRYEPCHCWRCFCEHFPKWMRARWRISAHNFTDERKHDPRAAIVFSSRGYYWDRSPELRARLLLP
jgi:hypothetical protein